MSDSTFTLSPRGPFSLATTRDFLAGFPPSSDTWLEAGGRLRLAFALDGTYEPGGVSLREERGLVLGEVFGTEDIETAARQTERILSLNHDGTGWPEVGTRDPVIGRIQAGYPGLRHICFSSPYEAAAWGILSQRIQMTQAARIKARLLEALGDPLLIDGQELRAFPRPERVLGLTAFPSVPAEKLSRLHGIAQAALDGLLDADHLSALSTEAAVTELSTLRGVGSWTAALIHLRGVGPPDELPMNEPKIRQAVARAYALVAPPDDAEFEAIAEAWRPYRMWVVFLLRIWLAR